MTGDILFLSHRVPFPPDRGDKIRSHHLLKALAQLAPVHVGTFGETEDDMAAEVELKALAKSHLLIERTKPVHLAGVEGLLSGKPVSLTAFHDRRLREWVESTIAAHPVTTIFVFSGQMGQYVPDDFAGRVVIDLCDVDSAKFEAYAEQGHLPRSVIDRREGRLLKAEEARLAQRADSVLLVSEAEADLFRARLGDGIHAAIHALRNGIDSAFFDPAQVVGPSPYGGSSGPNCVFTGQMDYAPNIAAVERVARRILPLLRETTPDAQFHIVGRAPTEAVRRLGTIDGVKVWGGVPDVRPFIQSADIVLAPLTIARGIQNKVLEAMAMARPVVLSPEAATGIDATDGAHFTVARDDAGLVQRIEDLLDKPEKRRAMGAAAREYVIANQSWEAMLEPLATLVGGHRELGRRHVA